jgi:hypothetical protein
MVNYSNGKIYKIEPNCEHEEEEIYTPESGVITAYVIEKRKFESFVEQQDFRINQIIDTFNSEGELYKSYRIVKVDKENDYIQIQDGADVKYIEIHNALGRKVLDFNVVNSGRYDIGDLARGMYMVRMLDRNRNIIRTQRISKYNP